MRPNHAYTAQYLFAEQSARGHRRTLEAVSRA
jgi:hypothetical protein